MLNEFKLLRQVNLKPYMAIWFIQLIIGVVASYFWRLFLENPESQNLIIWMGVMSADCGATYISSYFSPQLKVELKAAFTKKHHVRYQLQDPEIRRIQDTDDFSRKIFSAWESLKYASLTLLDMVPMSIRLVSCLWQIYLVSYVAITWVVFGHSLVFYILFRRVKTFNAGYYEYDTVRGKIQKILYNMYQMYGKFHTIDNRVGNRIEVLENEQLVVGAWRDSFWMQHEALSSFSGIFVLLGVLYLLPINKEYLPVILLITYLEGNIVSLSQKIGRIDFWDVQIKDLNTLEAEWGQPYEYIGTEDVPEKMSLQHIKKSYLGRNFELTQTETLYIEQGDIIRIWGESGNGKSTLLGIICGAFKVCYSLIRCDNSYWYSEGFRSFKKGQILEFPQNMGRMTSKECFRNLASTYVDSPTDNELTKVLTIVCLIDWWNNENFDFDRPLPGKDRKSVV